MGDAEVYGAALARAHQLEAQVAVYPRIVVGEELRRYLLLVAAMPVRNQLSAIAKRLAEECTSLLAHDKNDVWILDYLGPGVQRIAGRGMPKEAIPRAYAWARGEYEKFVRQGNPKLAPRYQQLVSYLESRIGLWGVQIGS